MNQTNEDPKKVEGNQEESCDCQECKCENGKCEEGCKCEGKCDGHCEDKK